MEIEDATQDADCGRQKFIRLNPTKSDLSIFSKANLGRIYDTGFAIYKRYGDAGAKELPCLNVPTAQANRVASTFAVFWRERKDGALIVFVFPFGRVLIGNVFRKAPEGRRTPRRWRVGENSYPLTARF